MTRPLPVRLHLDDVPIPTDVRPCAGWTSVMMEMAAHVGCYATLLIVDQFGGTDPYVPKDWTRSPFTDLIGEALARKMSDIYGRERLQVPVAGAALRRARRAGIIAAIRAKQMSLTDAARIKGAGSRTYLSALVNHSVEGKGAIPLIPKPKTDPRQLVMFGGDDHLREDAA